MGGMAPAGFSSAMHRVAGTTRVELHGELDCASVPLLEGKLDGVIVDGAGRVLLDLRDLRFMDVTALRMAVRLEARAQLHGVDFALVRGPRPVQRVFEMTGMERFVPAVDAA
jgi:anti-sigma B factor antagonist